MVTFCSFPDFEPSISKPSLKEITLGPMLLTGQNSTNCPVLQRNVGRAWLVLRQSTGETPVPPKDWYQGSSTASPTSTSPGAFQETNYNPAVVQRRGAGEGDPEVVVAEALEPAGLAPPGLPPGLPGPGPVGPQGTCSFWAWPNSRMIRARSCTRLAGRGGRSAAGVPGRGE